MNPKLETQGVVNGIGRAVSDEGEVKAGIRNGVRTRDGHVITVYSLDDVSTAVLNFCIETWDLHDDSVGSVKLEFSKVQE